MLDNGGRHLRVTAVSFGDVAGLQAVEPDAVGYLVVVVCKYAHHNTNFLGIVKNYPYFCNQLTEMG